MVAIGTANETAPPELGTSVRLRSRDVGTVPSAMQLQDRFDDRGPLQELTPQKIRQQRPQAQGSVQRF